ncbi:MAG: NAD(P)/FAD-dependent oxidoreductase [Hyphomicrobiales bacterium]|nr:NAD(P)/FAD-dependent oxidoreductase [Hyphomicrobiales bacterium]
MISRRDFLNGTALAIAAGLSPAAQIAAQPALQERYPPALTGLRGQHPGAFETAHARAFGTLRINVDGLPISERYDLVVVGGGISGLAAAWFYRRRVGAAARILILDNHDDFGGHARRNELVVGERRLIGYGGSESIDAPRKNYAGAAGALIRELGVDVARFEIAFDRSLYASHGLSRGVFFAREAFGRDTLVAGEPPWRGIDPATRRLANARPLAAFIADFPVSAQSKAQLLALHEGGRDPLAGRTAKQKRALLKRTSYRDYLMHHCGLSEEAANCFQGRTLGFFGLGCDAVPAADARDLGYPGFHALGLSAELAEREPYIYHFPDGNASLARLLVRALVPDVAPGAGMDDVVLAAFDYGELDRDGAPVRIRLESTCLDVRNAGAEVQVTYSRAGTVQRVAAGHVVLACFHMVIPHIMPELSPKQRAALAANVKTPIVYTNVLVRDWRAWLRLGVHDISAPMSFHSRVKLDFPVSLGGYCHARDPAEPIVLHLVHVPAAPNQGLDARTQFRVGQGKLLQMTFADFETVIRDELDRMLGPGGFVSARDIAAITVNRWPHGYGYVANSLFDRDDYDEVLKLARRKAGRVAIANSDAGGDAYAHLAIGQAARAVAELPG